MNALNLAQQISFFISPNTCSAASEQLQGRCYRISCLLLLIVVYSLHHSYYHTSKKRSLFLIFRPVWTHQAQSFYGGLWCLFHWYWTHFLAKPKVKETTNGLKHNVAIWTKVSNTEAVKFFLSAWCIEAFIVSFWLVLSEKRHGQIFKASSFVSMVGESPGFWNKIQTCIKTSWYRLTHSVRVEWVSVTTDNRFTNNRRYPIESFVNDCFTCKNNRWTTIKTFSSFLQ